MKSILIANWKMKLGQKESVDLAKKIKEGLCKKNMKIYDRFIGVRDRWKKNFDVVLCPSFTALSEVQKILPNTGINLGVQNIFWEEKGAYTGEIAVSMVKEIGAKYAIIGHSERRQNLAETDQMVHKKIRLALTEGIIPILCIGETFEERKAGQKDYVLVKQLIKALEGIDFSENQQCIIGYEPVWVIGTGQAVDPEEAELAAKLIKNSLLDLFSQKFIDNNIPVIYGGSVTSKDAKSFLVQPDINGLLIGGASLKADEFLQIIENSL